jgi:choline dehydrogenase-like flavoprotein
VINDLESGGPHVVHVDVLVIGGGTVGLLVAVRLAERGRQVVVVESGGLRQDGDCHELNDVVQTRASYQGAAHGRFRCLGGTSTRWGGALIPFAPADCRLDEWPIDPAEVFCHLPDGETLFGLNHGSYEAPEVFAGPGSDFCARLAKWPRFQRRNVAALFAEQLREWQHLQVWLHATATEFTVVDGALRTVTAKSLTGGELRIFAREVVIAAGAIESTRLLLLMDAQNAHLLFKGDGQLGRFFTDHLSVAVADVTPTDRSALNRLVGFRFEQNGVMRNIRFELATDTPLRHSIPPCFAHVAFTDEGGGGFNALRELLRLLQRGRPPGWRVLWPLAASAPWLVRALWWRLARHRLLYPQQSKIRLFMVVEQAPRADNQIRLSQDRSDALGSPLAEISWQVTQEDTDNVRRATDAFVGAWNDSALGRCARLERYAVEQVTQDLARGGGVFHPVGSVRMADRPERGVVDANLRPFRVRNVSVVSTAVLPRSGGSNPTMTLLCLGIRCSEHLDRQLLEPGRPHRTNRADRARMPRASHV